jgi:hypothetical protein
MARWLIGVIGALLVAVLLIRPAFNGRQTQPVGERIPETEYEPPVPVDSRAIPTLAKPTADSSIAPIRPPVRQERTSDLSSDQSINYVERLRPRAIGEIDLLKRVYRTESSDATSRETERLIRNEFGNDMVPIDALQHVSCHTSVCKIDLYWTEKNPTVLMALQMKLGPAMTGQMALDPAPEPDRRGRVLVELYVVRKGYDVIRAES